MILHFQRAFVGALVPLAFAAIATAQQPVCHDFDVPSTSTSFTTTIRVPKFDPSGGDVLTSVTVNVSGRGDGALYMENHGASPTTVTSHFSGTVDVLRPDTTVLVTGGFDQMFTDNLAAFDGNQNFGGPSGRKHENLAVNFSLNHVSAPPVSDLALFTGTGHVMLTINVTDTSSFMPGANLVTKDKQVADMKIDVCYRFAKDCNHNGLDDAIDIQNGAPDHNHDGVPDECQPGTKEECEGGGQSTGTTNCPCGNNLPTGQHGGCINQNGVGSHLTATGNPSVSNDTLVLSATNGVPGPGYFLQGTALINGGAGTTFGNGLRCIGGTVIRIRKIPNGSGVGQLPTPMGPPIHILLGINAGETHYYQVWYRDPFGPCGQPFNTSNAVFVVWGL